MSGRLVGEILDHAPADLRPAEMLTLVALAESAKDTDRTARYQSDVNTLAQRTRLSPGTIRNALSELTRRGILQTLVTVHQGKSQEYQIAKLDSHHRFNAATRQRVTPR